MTTSLRASLAFINVPSDNPTKSRDFYQELFGIELVPSLWNEESYHAPISQDGIDLDINIRHSPQEGAMPFFAVEDLSQALRLTTKNGGRILWGPDDLPIPENDRDDYRQSVKEIDGMDVQTDSLGRAAIVSDPGGSQVGLVQLEEHTHRHFAVGRHQQPLTDYQRKVHQRSMKIAEKLHR